MSVHELLGARRPDPLVEAILRRDTRRSVTLLVEAGFDQRFWRIYAHEDCAVVHQDQGGRQAALDKLQAAAKHPEVRMLAVLDADLDRVEGGLRLVPNVIWTDAHDLETTLLGLPTLEKLLRQQVEQQRLDEHTSRWGEPVRERLFRHGVILGKLRWLKQRERLDELKFHKPGKASQKGQRLRFSDYHKCTADDWTPSAEQTVQALLNYNSAQHLRARALPAELAALHHDDPAQLCNGHDLLGLLHALLRYVFKCSAAPDVDTLEHLLAASCERLWLAKTTMWRDIQAWEAEHPGFSVLAASEPRPG